MMQPIELGHLIDQMEAEGLLAAGPGDQRDAINALIDDLRADRPFQAGMSFHLLRETGAARALRDRLRAAINAAFADQQLELTNHGMMRTFRFWTPEEKTVFIGHTQALIALLRARVSPHVCVGYGTALGVARTGGFIPHDDDIDLLVGLPIRDFPTFADAAAHVAAQLPEEDYEVVRVEAVPNLLHVNGAVHFDIFIGIEEEGRYFSSFPGPRRKLPVQMLFPTVMRSVEGSMLPFPRDLTGYARAVFGEDWQVPQADWAHDWNILTEYSDLAGVAPDEIANPQPEPTTAEVMTRQDALRGRYPTASDGADATVALVTSLGTAARRAQAVVRQLGLFS